MRRKDREVTNKDEILEIIRKCDVCRLAFYDEDYPYIIPMNFGFSSEGADIELLFHCANAGKKLDLIKANPKAGFEMDCSHKLILGKEKDCNSTMEYESICGNGMIEILSEDRKVYALTQLMNQYSSKDNFEFSEKDLMGITVFKLTVQHIYAKRLKRS